MKPVYNADLYYFHEHTGFGSVETGKDSGFDTVSIPRVPVSRRYQPELAAQVPRTHRLVSSYATHPLPETLN
jgi:hypothetical protein